MASAFAWNRRTPLAYADRMKQVRRLIEGMALNGPAAREAVERAEAALGVRLPADYVEFLLQHNGGEGPVGAEGWGALAAIEDLPQTQADYAELDHLAGWIIFGSDGGGEAFVFDQEGVVLVVPWIGGREDAVAQGSFVDFLQRLADGRLLDPTEA